MLVFGPAVLLAAATALAALDLARDDRRIRLAALGLAAAGAIARVLAFVEPGVCPLGSRGGALGVLALFLTLHVLLGFRVAVAEPLRNVALLGLATVFDLAGRLVDRGVGGASVADRDPVAEIHAGALMLAYTALAVAAVYAAAYLSLDLLVRRRRVGFWFDRIPPLARLELRVGRAETLGFWLLTVGLALGIDLAVEGRVGAAGDPKVAAAGALWLVTAAFVWLRRRGHRGARLMWLPLVGLALMLAAYVAPGSRHPFGEGPS